MVRVVFFQNMVFKQLDIKLQKKSQLFPHRYKKVTSNTVGLSTDRQVVLNMLWQPYLAYEDDSTYKMLFTDNDADLKQNFHQSS